ncbi:MAG: hypothetical protein AMJ94_04880 [Deltaproteobacteria bacterium SM23_61]|nr:MAG: hypothetical protein AMJ94_04880 [Deltaproteobacteria bacterium SM23_61]
MEGGYHKKGQWFINFSGLFLSSDQPLVEGAVLRVLLMGNLLSSSPYYTQARGCADKRAIGQNASGTPKYSPNFFMGGGPGFMN